LGLEYRVSLRRVRFYITSVVVWVKSITKIYVLNSTVLIKEYGFLGCVRRPTNTKQAERRTEVSLGL
jgi:hypothetical protein